MLVAYAKLPLTANAEDVLAGAESTVNLDSAASAANQLVGRRGSTQSSTSSAPTEQKVTLPKDVGLPCRENFLQVLHEKELNMHLPSDFPDVHNLIDVSQTLVIYLFSLTVHRR